MSGCIWLLTRFHGLAPTAAAFVLGLGSLAAGIVAAGGVLSIRRQRRVELCLPDLYLEMNGRIAESVISGGLHPRPGRLRRALARALYGQSLLVGDVVRIRHSSEIESTLDESQALQALPFMAEMRQYCGQRAYVYRVVDKIYDYGRSRTMRRLRDSVLLAGLRCDGSGHAGCEASCYLIWKAAWLNVDSDGMAKQVEGRPQMAGSVARVEGPLASDSEFKCQFTELTASSRPTGWREALNAAFPLRSLVLGNMTGSAFLVLTLTRAFGHFQRLRGGIEYPARPPAASGAEGAGVPDLPVPGDTVTVRSAPEISASLGSGGRTRGLWFDRDMWKHCGGRYRVRSHVTQLIDIKTCRMIKTKSPCILLEGVDYSGEFQSGGEQHEFLFWRDSWLRRA